MHLLTRALSSNEQQQLRCMPHAPMGACCAGGLPAALRASALRAAISAIISS